MKNFEKVFEEHGYSLFRVHETEDAIIDAIKSEDQRYLYGIPLLIERSEIDYNYLLEKAKKESITERLLEVLSISSKIIKNSEKRSDIDAIISKKKIRIKFNISEFEEIYNRYQKKDKNLFPSNVNYFLSFLFAKKQRDILYKVKKREVLTKTEKEYYSRVIKKKIRAIKEVYGLVKEINI